MKSCGISRYALTAKIFAAWWWELFSSCFAFWCLKYFALDEGQRWSAKNRQQNVSWNAWQWNNGRGWWFMSVEWRIVLMVTGFGSVFSVIGLLISCLLTGQIHLFSVTNPALRSDPVEMNSKFSKIMRHCAKIHTLLRHSEGPRVWKNTFQWDARWINNKTANL